MATIRKLMDLRGRRALVTGAGGNLGTVIAESLAELGADLLLVDLHSAVIAKLATRLTREYGVAATPLVCDLEDAAERQCMTKEALSSGGLNILINNAAFVGTSNLTGWAEPFENQSVETWRRALEVNLTAAFHVSQLFSNALKAGEGGNIINIASIYGQWGPDWSLYKGTEMANPAAYGASKGGLIQFTRWLATTLAPHVRVNAIAPGGIARNQPASFVSNYEARTPLGRMATEEDFHGAVTYLASDMSQYVTGHILPIDGGWGVW